MSLNDRLNEIEKKLQAALNTQPADLPDWQIAGFALEAVRRGDMAEAGRWFTMPPVQPDLEFQNRMDGPMPAINDSRRTGVPLPRCDDPDEAVAISLAGLACDVVDGPAPMTQTTPVDEKPPSPRPRLDLGDDEIPVID